MEYLKNQLVHQLNHNWRAIFSAFLLVSAAFLIIGLLILGMRNFLALADRYFDQRYYSFLLTGGLSSEDIADLKSDLQKIAPDLKIRHYDRQELLTDFSKSLKGEGLPLDHNLIELGGSLDFTITKPDESQKQAFLAVALSQSVADMVSNSSFSTEVIYFLSILKKITYGFIALVALGSALSVYIVIQLLVYSSSRDIIIVRSLGGSWWFILKPFLTVALMIVSLGYLSAISLVWLITKLGKIFINRLDLLIYLPDEFDFLTFSELRLLFLATIFLGVISAYFAGSRVLGIIDRL